MGMLGFKLNLLLDVMGANCVQLGAEPTSSEHQDDGCPETNFSEGVHQTVLYATSVKCISRNIRASQAHSNTGKFYRRELPKNILERTRRSTGAVPVTCAEITPALIPS